MLAKSLAATVITSTLKLLVPILLGLAVDHTQIMLSNPSGAVGATATLWGTAVLVLGVLVGRGLP